MLKGGKKCVFSIVFKVQYLNELTSYKLHIYVKKMIFSITYLKILHIKYCIL